MKTMKLVLLMTVLMAASVAWAYAQDTSAAKPNVLADGANAKSARVDNMHMTRFLEIYIAAQILRLGSLFRLLQHYVYTTGHS